MMYGLTIRGIEARGKWWTSALRRLLVELTFEAVIPGMRWQPGGASLSSLTNKPLVLSRQFLLQAQLVAKAFFIWGLDHLAGILRELSLNQHSF